MNIRVKNPVYLTADRLRAVASDDPSAAFLLAGANGSVSQADAEKNGITEEGGKGSKTVKLDEGLEGIPPERRHLVNPNSRDGVNTDQNSPAATPAGEVVTAGDRSSGSVVIVDNREGAEEAPAKRGSKK